MAYMGMMDNAPGAGEDSAETPEVESTAEDRGEGEESSDRPTGFVPMDAFPERPKIGKVCSFRIIDVKEDGDVEIEYVDHAGKEAPSGPVAPWDKPNQSDSDEMLNT